MLAEGPASMAAQLGLQPFQNTLLPLFWGDTNSKLDWTLPTSPFVSPTLHSMDQPYAAPLPGALPVTSPAQTLLH